MRIIAPVPAREQLIPTTGPGIGPSDPFPDDLAALTDIDLPVLHSRMQCQLDHEYAHAFEANHETEFRYAEIRDEIGLREFSTSAGEPLVRRTAGC